MRQIAGLTLSEADYGKPDANGEKGTWKCKILAPSREAHDAMVEALQRAGIDFRPGTPFQNSWGSASGEPPSFLVEVASEVDKPHKRAIAKIFMNFVTFHLGREEALGPRWDFLHRYVRHGEGEIKARLSQRPFWTGQETEQLRFRDDSERHDPGFAVLPIVLPGEAAWPLSRPTKRLLAMATQ